MKAGLAYSGKQRVRTRENEQQGPKLLPRPGRRWESECDDSQRTHQNVELESKGERVRKRPAKEAVLITRLLGVKLYPIKLTH